MVRNRCGMASLIVLAGCAYALAAAAFPSRAELDKAEKLVNEIMSTDVAAFKAKSKTAADVASAALGYADEAQGEAAKFLLLKGAFFFQMRATDYDGAKATIGRIRGEIADVPDKVVADMLTSALRRVPRKHCGQLYDLLQRTQNRVRYAQEAHALAQQAKAKPTDRALLVRLGERYALLGDWERAIASFAAGEGKLAEMAQWERKYPATGITDLTTAKVADFWWDAGGDDDERTRAYRVHAAYWYRKAIENNAVPGLKKTLAEKRIAEAEKDADAIAAPAPSRASGLAAQPTLASKVAVGKGGPQPPPRTLRLGGGVDIEFVGCPAGSFMMGFKGDDRPRSVYRYHKVNITRPFWLSKYKVTHGMWNAYQKVSLTKEDNALGGMKRVHCVTPEEADAFCEWLAKRFRSNLPRGYVVRLPTEAEWEYALKANVTDPNDPYVRMSNKEANGRAAYMMSDSGVADFAFPDLGDYLVTWPHDVKRRLQMAGLWNKDYEESERQYTSTRIKGRYDLPLFYEILGTEVGTKKPNAWGLFDMAGNRGERLLDSVDPLRFREPFNQDTLCYADEETDPLHQVRLTAEQRSWANVRRGGFDAGGWCVPSAMSKSSGYRHHPLPFRLCIGPDLMKEKGFRK